MRTRVEIAERQRLNVRKQVAAHVFKHELADARDFHSTVAQTEFVNDDEHRQQCHQLAKQRKVFRRNDTVDHDFRQIRFHDVDAAHCRHDDEDPDHAGHVRFQVDADAREVTHIDLLFKVFIVTEGVALCHDVILPASYASNPCERPASTPNCLL